jgi:hypothetical protein
MSVISTQAVGINENDTAVNCEYDIKVMINEKPVCFDQSPVIINGRTLVPIRAVCEKLGADVYWLESVQVIMVVKNEIKFMLAVGINKMLKFIVTDFSELLDIVKDNDVSFQTEEIDLDAPPQIIGSRTLVPIRAVCEALGAKVDWNGETNTVIIACSEDIINDNNRDITFFDGFGAYFEGIIEEQKEDQIKKQNEIFKGEYSDFDYAATIKISCSSKYEEYVATREFITAKVDSANIGLYSMDLSEKNFIIIKFGFNEGFDINKFVVYLMKESNLYFTDDDNINILDKTDIVDAKPGWDGQMQQHNVEISLTEEGREKFAAATEALVGRKITILLDDYVIVSPVVQQKIDSDVFIISGISNSDTANAIVYLIKTKGIPENMELDSLNVVE